MMNMRDGYYKEIPHHHAHMPRRLKIQNEWCPISQDHYRNPKLLIKNLKKNDKNLCGNIPGLRKLFDPSYTIVGKVLWLLALLLCVVSCGYQLYVLISYYFSYPIVVDIGIHRNNSLWFPSATFCPADFYANYKNKFEENFGSSAEAIWEKFKIENQDMKRKISCSTAASENSNQNGCKDGRMDFQMRSSSVNTLYGTCLSLTPEIPMLFRGPDTYISFQLTDSKMPEESSRKKRQFSSISSATGISADEEWLKFFAFYVYLHSPDQIPRHDISYLSEVTFRKYFTDYRLAVKEFRFLNTRNNPCVDENVFIKCRDACIDRKLEKILPCSLPFVKSKELRICSGTHEIIQAYEKTKAFYRTMQDSDCNCIRKCRDVLYSFTPDVGFQPPKDKTELHVSYPVNIHEIITEKYGYTLANLLSDIVGNLGFYLGVCALTVIEVIDSFIRRNISH